VVVGDIPKQNENARRPTPNDDSEDWYTVIYELELKVRHTVDLTGMRNTRQLGASTNVPNKREEMSHYTPEESIYRLHGEIGVPVIRVQGLLTASSCTRPT
jgi:hypothetical protein